MDLNSFSYLDNQQPNAFVDMANLYLANRASYSSFVTNFNNTFSLNITSPATSSNIANNVPPAGPRRELYVWYVKVKTSAHVSYIVGKQGRKIRELRQRTQTNIITPVNGDEPKFEICGAVYRNVLAAGEHIKEEEARFDQAMQDEARAASNDKVYCLNFFLPQNMIGLVVGRAGNTIKGIMERTRTEIETPKVNTINRFKISGTKADVDRAVEEIANQITQNTRLSFKRTYDDHSLTFEL